LINRLLQLHSLLLRLLRQAFKRRIIRQSVSTSNGRHLAHVRRRRSRVCTYICTLRASNNGGQAGPGLTKEIPFLRHRRESKGESSRARMDLESSPSTTSFPPRLFPARPLACADRWGDLSSVLGTKGSLLLRVTLRTEGKINHSAPKGGAAAGRVGRVGRVDREIPENPLMNLHFFRPFLPPQMIDDAQERPTHLRLLSPFLEMTPGLADSWQFPDLCFPSLVPPAATAGASTFTRPNDGHSRRGGRQFALVKGSQRTLLKTGREEGSRRDQQGRQTCGQTE